MLRKFKLYLLGHLVEDIREFRPLVGLATENYESYNSIFRACSILSNHHAPSRDRSHQIGHQESMKHRLSGGRWWNPLTKSWNQAGEGYILIKLATGLFKNVLVGQRPKNVTQEAWLAGQEVKLMNTRARLAMNADTYAHEMAFMWTKC
ncbi:hypothetical protein PM082_002293 [Marasmius tenuissimus]|nr:hypothetical protein PM082_002293 [Marasmius tenuissimus]